MIEKKHDPYELLFGAVYAPREDAVQKPKEVFDVEAARREIVELTRKISEERKNQGSSALAAKYQYEIVVLRQRIIDNEMKKTK